MLLTEILFLFALQYNGLHKGITMKTKNICLISILVLLIYILINFSVNPLPKYKSSSKNDSTRIYTTQTFPNQMITDKEVHIDLDSIKARGKLIALTRYNANSFFLYRGQPMGYEYELLKLFTQRIGVDLEVKIPSTRDSLFIMLNNGEGDVIAASLTITLERRDKVLFSTPYNTSRQMLVQRKPKDWRRLKHHQIEKELIRNPLELIGKTVSIRSGSNYEQRLRNLEEEMGGLINIDTVANNIETEKLIKMVNDGKIDYTIADENIATINSPFYPNVDMKTAISCPQQIAWAFRKSSPQLQQAVNDWIADEKAKKSPTLNVIYKKYYKNKSRFKRRKRSQFYSLETGKISPYDDLFKKYQFPPLFPWTLLAAQAYQESHFNPKTTSWAGAEGLMQLLPNTAKEFGITDLTDPEQGIKAGVKYIKFIEKNYWGSIPSDSERVKFILASYNAGVGHVKDAQRVAKLLKLDPNIWTNNVEVAILKLSEKEYIYNNKYVKYGFCRGEEPYNYVREILKREQLYKGFLKEAEILKADTTVNLNDTLKQKI